MKRFYLLVVAAFFAYSTGFAKNDWPREITTVKGVVITLFQPQNESLKGNILISRTVVSVKKDEKSEPVFGVIWSEAHLNTDLDTRLAALEKLKITDTKFPENTDQTKLAEFKALLEQEIPKWNLILSIDEIVATLEEDPTVSSANLNMAAPEIVYADKPTTLILIDGEPIVKTNEDIKLETVVNTPFLLVKSKSDGKFYLTTGKHWYVSTEIMKGWAFIKSLPKDVKKLQQEIDKKAKENGENAVDTTDSKPTAILVKTKPTELIQTNGEASFASIEGTGLLYVTNSPDYIFKAVADQQYYILLTGRWYHSGALNGQWNNVPSDKLPPDFAKIPEGSDMDIVLANVAGTDAAKEAVKEAQIPQTAKVDRKNTTCTVSWDGSPKFSKIEGTGLEVAENSSITVIKSGKKYYAVDNGVWFIADNPKGPWAVSEERPEEVEKIPPDNQAYNVQYVYIYDVTPTYIYMGYTPGYMGCYVYGPTVVYGTGYYYAPWYGAVYYPRPVTYGFSMHYNPWTGWSMGFHYNTGCFHFSVYGGGYPGGYWGPPMYRPPYYHYPPYHRPPPPGHYHQGGGYYGQQPQPPRESRPGDPPNSGNQGNRGNSVNNSLPNQKNNLYDQRAGVSTRDVQPDRGSASKGGNKNQVSNRQQGGNQGGASVSTQPANRDLKAPTTQPKTSNNMYADKSGNVYKNDQSGNWQKRENNSWQNTGNTNTRQLDQSKQQRDRSSMRTTQSSATRSQASRPSSGSMNRGGGGGRAGGGRR